MSRPRVYTSLAVAFAAATVTAYDSPQSGVDDVIVTAKANRPVGEAYIRVVDVGNAMCVVAKAPTGETLLFDAGNKNTDECAAAVRELVGEHTPIDLVVLSHSDADHVGEVPAILANNHARQLVYTGAQGTARELWPQVAAALDTAQRRDGTIIRNLGDQPLPNTIDPAPGQSRAAPLTVSLGQARVTFVAGWHEWPYASERGASLAAAEKRNVISIVVRYEFAGQSVLLTGDTVGRRGKTTESPDACRDAERWMVERGNVPLGSDVLVGQHHGADNSSSACFLRAVSPDFVVFPAGHSGHEHPRQAAAERVLAAHVPLANIFRTDRGDDDKGDTEWSEGLEPGCIDKAGDDDVEIILSARSAQPVVRYRQPWVACALKR